MRTEETGVRRAGNGENNMKITWFGTASFLVEAAGERILFDPFVELEGGEHPNRLEDFLGVGDICITHGHLDHMMDVPALLGDAWAEDGEGQGAGARDVPAGTGPGAARKFGRPLAEATVYCPAVAAKTLEKRGVEPGHIVQVRPGDRWKIGSVEVAAFPGKHARPGIQCVPRVLFRLGSLSMLRNALFLAWTHFHFPEGKQTYLYQVCAEGKRLLVMGSMGLPEGFPEGVQGSGAGRARPGGGAGRAGSGDEACRAGRQGGRPGRTTGETVLRGADLLILPFTCCAHPEREALDIIRRLAPKRVLLSHFDDSFPPVSRHMDTRRLHMLVSREFPQLEVVKPTAGKPVFF